MKYMVTDSFESVEQNQRHISVLAFQDVIVSSCRDTDGGGPVEKLWKPLTSACTPAMPDG